jgi:cytochrome c553
MNRQTLMAIATACISLLPHHAIAQQDAEALAASKQTTCVSCHAQWKHKARR